MNAHPMLDGLISFFDTTGFMRRWVRPPEPGALAREEEARTSELAAVNASLRHEVQQRQHAEASARFLADASAALGSLVDEESTLRTVARLAVPSFAHVCAVHVQKPGEGLALVALASAEEPASVRNRPSGWSAALTGELLQYPVFEHGRADYGTIGADAPPSLAALRDLRVKSYLVVPMAAHGLRVGVLTFLTLADQRPLDSCDVAVGADLASRTAVAVENARLYNELRTVDRRRDEFLAVLAHELRNPLAPMVTVLELFERSDDPETFERGRSILARQVKSLGRLVDDLLDVGRIRQGKVQLRRSPVTLQDVVTSAIEVASPAIAAKEHRFTVEVPTPDALLDVDPIRLAQVLTNLLSNAAKYTASGGQVTLTTRVSTEGVEFAVADTGRGLAPEMLERVFEMFTQGVQAGTGGLGIGLFLVRQLIELHGGHVRAESGGAGRGSRFVVTLPAASVLATGRRDTRDIEAAPRERRILIVDDNVDAMESLRLLLELEGHTVEVAGDGASALSVAASFQPQVVLLDIGLPGISGYEVAQRLRARPEGPALKIVAVTGWGAYEDRVRSRCAGIDAHLVKPLTMDDLNRALTM